MVAMSLLSPSRNTILHPAPCSVCSPLLPLSEYAGGNDS